MIIFLGGSALYIILWSLMFRSVVFRLAFLSWTFFAIWFFLTILSILLSVALGVLCLLKFGKGLNHHREPYNPPAPSKQLLIS